MKNTSKKHEGSTLIEIVISMAIIATIIIGVYNGYMIIIKQTKAGQVKQTVALEGKKTIEEIKATIEDKSFNVSDNTLQIGDIGLAKQSTDSTGVHYTRYLDQNYSECNKEVSKYTETITLKKTQAKINGTDKDVNSAGELVNGSSSIKVGTFDYTVFISKKENGHIEIDGDKNTGIDVKDSETSSVELTVKSEAVKLFIYTDCDNTNKEKTIIIKDNNGDEVLTRTFKNIEIKDQKKQIKFTINFKDYKLAKDSSYKLEDIQINLYNKDSEPLNVCLQKSIDLKAVDVEPLKGEVNIYDNRSETGTLIGELNDIKVEIGYTGGENLFTGYSNENI